MEVMAKADKEGEAATEAGRAGGVMEAREARVEG